MDLEQHLRGSPAKLSIEVDHCLFDDVGSRTLDRGIQGHSLTRLPVSEARARQLREVTPTTEQRRRVALDRCPLHHAL